MRPCAQPGSWRFYLQERLMTGSIPEHAGVSRQALDPDVLCSVTLPDWRKLTDTAGLAFEFQQNRSRSGFQPFCRTTGVDLRDFQGKARWLLATGTTAEKQSDLAQSLVRSLFVTAASTIKDPEFRDHFSNPELSDKQLIEALAFVESPERLKCVRALLFLSSQYPQIGSFLEQKLNNILHFASSEERALLIKECLKADSASGSPENIRRMLAASVDLDQICQLIGECGKAALLSLNHRGIRELTARSCLLRKLRNLPERSAPDAQQPETTEARIGRLETMIEAGGALCSEDAALADSSFARRMLKRLSAHLSDLRALRQSGPESQKTALDLDLIEARLKFEFYYGIRLADEPRNTANTHRCWSVSEIEEARQVMERIPEGRLLFTPKLHTIQRVRTLGNHILGLRADNGTIKITDAAVAHPHVELAYRGKSSFQITLTHELGHAIQLGPEGPGLKEDGQDLTIIPGDPCYNFKEFMQLSNWQIISPERFKVQDSGLSVLLDGTALPTGVPCSFQGRRIILVYNQGLLMSYDTSADFSLIDYSRTNPWEDWAESFCEYIMLPERLLKFAPQKFMYFEEEFRKYSGVGLAALLKRLEQNRKHDNDESLPQAA